LEEWGVKVKVAITEVADHTDKRYSFCWWKAPEVGKGVGAKGLRKIAKRGKKTVMLPFIEWVEDESRFNIVWIKKLIT
jgi:hypothetical protein